MIRYLSPFAFRRRAASLTVAAATAFAILAPLSAQEGPSQQARDASAVAISGWSDEQILTQLAQYGSPSTFAAIVVDFDRLKAAPFADAMRQVATLSAEEDAKLTEALNSAEKTLRDLGVHEALILAHVHPTRQVALTAIARVDQAEAATGRLIDENWGFKTEIVGDTLLLRPRGEEVQGGLQDVETAREALAAAGDAPVRAVVFFSPDMRRVLNEFAFVMGDEQVVGAIRGLAKDLRWAALAISPEGHQGPGAAPTMSLDVRLRFASPEAAAAAGERMNALLARGRTELPKLEELPFPESTLDDAVRWLTPTVEESDLVLSRSLADETTVSLARDVVTPALVAMRAQADRSTTTNKLKQLAIAMHNFHDVNGYLPLGASQKKDGKAAGLSWRVHLLPYLEEGPLYQQFRLDEPWDSPHNKALIPRMPDVFDLEADLSPGKSNALVPMGEGQMFSGDEPTGFVDVTDGLSNTIMILQGSPSAAVIWTKPEDPAVDPSDFADQLGVEGAPTFSAALGDGSVRSIEKTLDVETMKAVLTRGGGEVANLP